MTIKGLNNAINIAINRVKRMKEPICVVQVGDDEFILWRESTKDALGLMYTNYKIVKTIRIRDDI